MTRSSKSAWFVLSLCLALVVILSASDSGAEATLSVQVDHYEITGTTANELRQGLDRHVGVNGRLAKHDAYTEWHVDWTFPFVKKNGRCGAGPLGVKVTVTHTVPKWNAPPTADPELVRKWNTYIDALEVHEAGHRRFGIAAGKEIVRALSQLGTYATCDELERVAKAAADKILERQRQKEKAYDLSTDHGASQGCRFP